MGRDSLNVQSAVGFLGALPLWPIKTEEGRARAPRQAWPRREALLPSLRLLQPPPLQLPERALRPPEHLPRRSRSRMVRGARQSQQPRSRLAPRWGGLRCEAEARGEGPRKRAWGWRPWCRAAEPRRGGGTGTQHLGGAKGEQLMGRGARARSPPGSQGMRGAATEGRGRV